jgi:hypothetical protein
LERLRSQVSFISSSFINKEKKWEEKTDQQPHSLRKKGIQISKHSDLFFFKRQLQKAVHPSIKDKSCLKLPPPGAYLLIILENIILT